ncbi:glycosyltransferase family 4 protein [Poriferisphaera corsica]|nr:glycosyltransferase family 4 protein [Poriferisphaera corsica]
MDKTTRVLIVQPALPKYRIPVFKELATRVGIDLTVLHATESDLKSEQAESFKDIKTSDKKINSPVGQLFWNHDHLKYASKKHTDVYIIVGNMRYLSLIPTVIKARLSGVRVVFWTHGCSKQKSRLRSALRESIYRLAHSIVFYTDTVRKQFEDAGWNPKNLFVAPNSIDLSPIDKEIQHWKNRPEALEAFAKDNQLEGKRNIIFVSRFSPKNRLDLLFKAVERLVREGMHDLKVILIGGGDDVRQTLEEQAANLKIQNNIIFTGPIYEETEIAKWMLNAQIFCYPSNMGLSVQHAIAYKLPVITSNEPRLHGPEIELITDNHTGLLYENGSADDLYQKLRLLLEDENKRKQLADQAYHRLTHEYGISNMVDGLVSCIRGK